MEVNSICKSPGGVAVDTKGLGSCDVAKSVTFELGYNVELFYYQLMHIILKNTELLKHSKITLQHVSVYIETIFRELKSVLG